MTKTEQTAATAHVGVSCNVLSPPEAPPAILSDNKNFLGQA